MREVKRVDVLRFLKQYTDGWRTQSKPVVCNALRSYFRFKALYGEPTADLMAAFPKLVNWRLARLPKTLGVTEIEQLLGAFDRGSVVGRRDYAIARCLVDLGLRTAEVARLTLDDLDWRNGTLQIRGKGRRIDLFPLPTATGRAISKCLRDGRPSILSRSLFVRHRAPLDAPITSGIVRVIMRTTAARCGLTALVNGPPLLRHTAAQRLMHGGATLKRVADVLRHRPLNTAAIFTKVDVRTLRPRGPAVAGEACINPRKTWQARVEAYVADRRRAGFKLSIAAMQLAGFARFAEQMGHHGPLTIEIASRWALASRRGARLTAARRIEVLRSFAQYWRQFDPATEIPPRQLFGPAHRRLTPPIYTDNEIRSMLKGAERLSPPGGLRAASCVALFGLIATTGLRISEATGLKRSDVDLKQGCC